MTASVYIKKGGLSPKEKKMVKALDAYVQQQGESFSFEPAQNFSELEEKYNKFCVSTVEFEESSPAAQSKLDLQASTSSETQDSTASASESSDDLHFNPLTRENPIIRDYVHEDGFSRNQTQEGPKSNFSEPLTFSESFEIPKEDKTDAQSSNSTASNNGFTMPGSSGKKEKPKPDYLNPEFEGMAQAKKNKSVKRFAKYIVEATCMLAEKGFVWFATKDINEAKLVEMELKGQISLDLLLTIDDGQQIPVRQFFSSLCLQAEQLSKIGAEEKQDLVDALTVVLLEKGIAPSPSQELILVSLTVFGKQAITLLAIKSQTNSVLMQLKLIKKQQTQESTSSPLAEPAPQNGTDSAQDAEKEGHFEPATTSTSDN